MKVTTSAFLFALITPFHIAQANEEMTDHEIDVKTYCEEQAQLAEIEDAQESVQYIQECIDSFAAPSGDML